MFSRITSILLPTATLLLLSSCSPSAEQGAESATVDSRFPGLSSGPLRQAAVVSLPGGTVLTADDMNIIAKDIADEIAKAPKPVQEQLKAYSFFALEQMTARKLLAKEAAEWASKNDVSTEQNDDLIRGYLESLVSDVTVADEEVARFYNENREMFGDATLDQVSPSVKAYLKGIKQGEIIERHVQGIGSRHPIRISAVWANQQYRRWVKNPVEQARTSGKPSMVNFGADGCAPCDMMAPIREEIAKQYGDRLNLVFVHVNEEQILAAHYGIASIPTLIFYDKEGKETFKHMGFMEKKLIEEKLAELGVK